MDGLGELNPKDYLESQASADYENGDKTVSLMVGGTKKDGEDFINALKKLGTDCEELKQEQQGGAVAGLAGRRVLDLALETRVEKIVPRRGRRLCGRVADE